jgi:Txe/YoeB family toxin of Txe-Axe toxin-antitoxin module
MTQRKDETREEYLARDREAARKRYAANPEKARECAAYNRAKFKILSGGISLSTSYHRRRRAALEDPFKAEVTQLWKQDPERLTSIVEELIKPPVEDPFKAEVTQLWKQDPRRFTAIIEELIKEKQS